MKKRVHFLLFAIFGVGVGANTAWAACSSSDATDCSSTLTNNPLPVVSSVSPNIMFMMDNSGSMATLVPPANTQTRLQVAKDAAISLINGLDKVRVGLFSYNSSSNGGVLREPLSEIDSAKRTTMTTKINALTASTWTPLASTLSDVGHYFARGYPDASNLKLHPGTASEATVTVNNVFNNNTYDVLSGVSVTSNPIQYYCQKSFVILLTDGMPTMDQSNTSTYLREYYGYCSNAANAANCRTFGRRNFQLSNVTSGTPTATVEGYEEGSNPSDYLDDVANALYDIDLRPDLVPPLPDTKQNKNNVSTYAIAFADPALATTTLLERAASYGGGLYMTASDSASLITAFQKAADDILSKDGSAAAVAVANAHVTNSDNASYVTSYNSGNWTGDLIAYPINTNTGVADITTPIWNATCTESAAVKSALVDPDRPSKGVRGCSAQILLASKGHSSRKIFTSNDTSTCRYNCGVPFQPTTATGASGTDKISTAQKSRLSTPSTTDGDDVVSYLRGVTTLETTPATYRSRPTISGLNKVNILGDMVNAEPALVREPERNYADTGYSTYKLNNENRTRLILQAANDGMVHAFNEYTGDEEWAYVPDLLISSTKNNDPGSSTTGILNTRTRKTNFNHYFMIDATPIVGDVDFDKANTATCASSPCSPSWKTIVVGGLGKARGYYALDLTTTTATTEALAAQKALWEFPRSISDATTRAEVAANLGYTFGKPIIAKTAAAGWVVLATSGYNNGADASQSTLTGSTTTTDGGGDGYGHLYVIDPKTGDLIKDIVTPQCNTAVTASAANSKLYPCGLTHINAYVEERDFDNTVTYVYGGDLYGNVWRFDLTGSATSSWSVTKLAVLRSANAVVQPITSAPELAKVTVSGTNYYYVYVGTGQYLDKTDLPCPPSPATCAWTPAYNVSQTQSMYGLIDPRSGSLPDPLRSSLLAQTITTATGGLSKTATQTAMTYTGGSAKKGWVMDLSSSERVVADAALAAGTLVFNTIIPNTEACQPGGSSWQYSVDYADGGAVLNSTTFGIKLANALASRPVLVQLPSGVIKAITRLSDATTLTTAIPTSATANAGKRVSWREIMDQ